MPQIQAEIVVAASPEVAFAVSQTTGLVRLSWDPFIRDQHFLDGAAQAGKGVRTLTRSRHGFAMISQYVSYAPPSNSKSGPSTTGSVGMTMTKGPWFFTNFGGGWRFTPTDDGGTRAVWKYTFSCRPRWLQPITHRIGSWLLGRDIRRRIDAFGRACSDPSVLEAVAQS